MTLGRENRVRYHWRVLINFFEIHPLFFLDQYRYGGDGSYGEGNIFNPASQLTLITPEEKSDDQPGSILISIFSGDQYRDHPQHSQ
jgi:hypothetical protein